MTEPNRNPANVDEITYTLTDDDGKEIRKELSKEVLTKGAWATLLFKYQEIDRKTQDFGAEKAAIVRYRKMKGVYRRQKDFAITNKKQARQIVDILNGWFPEGA